MNTSPTFLLFKENGVSFVEMEVDHELSDTELHGFAFLAL